MNAYSPRAEFVHITDYFRQGAKDENWIPQLGREGGWVVITSDGGKQSKRGQKLPDLCAAYKVTHVILSASLHRKKSHEKVGVLSAIWSEIAALHQSPQGSRYRLRYKSAKGKAGLAVLLERALLPPIPECNPESPNAASGENDCSIQ